MNSDTYESGATKHALEIYEWDRLWIDHPEDTETGRILYIGDSISYGTRSVIAKLEENPYRWDGFATSKGADNPYFADTLRLFAKQAPTPDLILFNNGLHGWHMDDETDYARAYEALLQVLGEGWQGVPLVLLLTTRVADSERDERVRHRNEAVSSLAERRGLPVLDLYSVSLANRERQLPDGVHFTPEGYEALARAILAFAKTFKQ